MNNTLNTQTVPRNSSEMDTLQGILYQNQMELDALEFKEHNTTDPNIEIDPDNNFFSSIVTDYNYLTQEQYENSITSVGKLSMIHFNSIHSSLQYHSQYRNLV